MDSPEVTFTLAYLVLAVCFVFTPTEFHSAGLTVQNLLSGWLGSEDAAFVRYHQRRTAATLLCHSLLPLGEARAPPLPSSGPIGGGPRGHLPLRKSRGGGGSGIPGCPEPRGGGPTARAFHAGGSWSVAGGRTRAASPGEDACPAGAGGERSLDGSSRRGARVSGFQQGDEGPWPRPRAVGVGRAGGDG